MLVSRVWISGNRLGSLEDSCWAVFLSILLAGELCALSRSWCAFLLGPGPSQRTRWCSLQPWRGWNPILIAQERLLQQHAWLYSLMCWCEPNPRFPPFQVTDGTLIASSLPALHMLEMPTSLHHWRSAYYWSRSSPYGLAGMNDCRGQLWYRTRYG